ncbi:MAG: hypothetical protein JNL97_01270 [Verrucomicrobiales bacterium]|nr:hypothetical protein [Verrucomicrobiales bacterium]
MKRYFETTLLRTAGALLLGIAATGTWVVPTLGQATGGAFRLDAGPVGGGGESKGGTFALRGAVLATPGGSSESVVVPGVGGPSFALIGGIWGPATGTAAKAPTIRAVLTPDKLAELTWDEETSGFVLEFSSTLGPTAVWTPVDPQPTGLRFVTPCQQPARFFRFRER